MRQHRSSYGRSVKEMQMSAEVLGINPHRSCCGLLITDYYSTTFTSYQNHFYRFWSSSWHLYFELFFENWTGIFFSDIKIIRAVRPSGLFLDFFSSQSRSINQSEFLTSFGFSYQKHLFCCDHVHTNDWRNAIFGLFLDFTTQWLCDQRDWWPKTNSGVV